MTTTYHTAIATGAAANASTFNTPLSTLDTQLTATQLELATARDTYSTLDARLDALVLAGGNIATLTDGAASAAQKVVTVDSTVGFVAGAYVAYVLVGGALEYNSIDTVDSTTQLTMDTNIGTGGIATDTYISMISPSEYLAAQAIPHDGDLTLPDAVEFAAGGIYNVEAYGASPGASGATNAAAIAAAIAAASAAGGGTVFLPFETYETDAFSMESDVYLLAYGTTLKLSASQTESLINFLDVTNSGILGLLQIDGNKANNTEIIHGVRISGSAADLHFDTLVIDDCPGDGFYVGRIGDTPTRIAVNSISINSCTRNGISLTNVDGIWFGRAVVRGSDGELPEAGVDIETNDAADFASNIVFDLLDVSGNTGNGLEILGKVRTQGGIFVNHLRSSNNGSAGLSIHTISNVTILSGDISANSAEGVVIPRDVERIKITAAIHDNGKRGVSAVMTSQTAASYDIDLSGCRVYNNGQSAANTYDGIRLDSDDAAKVLSNVFMSRVRSFDDQVSATQRYGLTTGANTSRIFFDGDFSGNASGSFTMGGGGHVRQNYKSGVATAITDGATISHSLGAVPRRASATGTVAAEIVTITAMSSTTLTIAIKTIAGAAGTSQSIYWEAETW